LPLALSCLVEFIAVTGAHSQEWLCHASYKPTTYKAPGSFRKVLKRWAEEVSRLTQAQTEVYATGGMRGLWVPQLLRAGGRLEKLVENTIEPREVARLLGPQGRTGARISDGSCAKVATPEHHKKSPT
jgi:hypothetical protein